MHTRRQSCIVIYMSNGYSKDKNHRINDQYGICWDAPAVESVKRSPSPAERAHRVGQSLGINGGIWDESEMYR